MAEEHRASNGSGGPPAATAKDKPEHGNTLFVTRLPYTATNTDLTTYFSDIGPVRRAFVVTDRETHKSKGVGYVTYADTADAQRALDTLQGKSIDGGRRAMELQWADKKIPSFVLRKEKKMAEEADTVVHVQTDAAAPARPKRAEVPRTNTLPGRDPDAVRTIVLSGLSACTPPADAKTIYKRARKIGDVEHVDFADADGAKSKDVAYVRFRTPNHAMEAVTKLHAHQFKGAQLSVSLKKRLDGALRREQHMRPDTLQKQKTMMSKVKEMNGDAWSLGQGGVGLSRESRVIVRNLPFDITLDDLRAIFLPYGAIYDVTVPTKNGDDQETSKHPPRGRGFAFVWFVSRSDAARAIEAVNGVSLRHGAAEQAALKKAQGKKGREMAKEALEKVQARAQPARTVAVDWSLSQKEWLARTEDGQAGAEDAPTKRPRAESDSDADSDADSDDDSEDGSEDDSEDADSDAASASSASEETKPKLATTETGTILFVRNLPYQATEQELKDLFRSFGPMRYAKITMDPATKRSRGTGFVCFWQKESADAALHDAEIVQRETAAGMHDGKPPKVNPFSVPSVITADPSAPLVARFTLHGRVLHVVRAVTRENASQLETSARKSREKGDTRNTWLLREGVPLPNTPLSKLLSEKEADKRMQNFSVRRAQLGANPSLHVSKTRLAVHQLPLYVSEKMLKRLALHALRAFTTEVKQGTRTDLDDEEKADTTASANIKSEPETEAGKKRPPPSLVIQSKIVRQNERADPISGKGRSRGYGFLEMRTFPHALKVLRWANGNKEVGDLLLQWWQEELEANIEKLKALPTPTDEDKARLKRMQTTFQDVKEGGGKAVKSEYRGMLRIEFSIENITTVRKRVLRQSQARESATKRARLDEAAPPPAESGKPRGAERRIHAQASKKIQAESQGRNALGSLIGKKRAERKRKHGGS